MEKLVLKGVMWGADKIPEHWFEKIPGAGDFFTPKESKNSHRRSSRDNDKAGSGRRKSTNVSRDRSHRRDDDDDRGYRSDDQRRSSRRNRKSYDGGEDGYDEDDTNYRSRRRGDRDGRRHRQNYDQPTSNGSRSGHARSNRDPPYPDDTDFQQQRRSTFAPTGVTPATAAAAAAGAEAASGANPSYNPTSNGYVPYANVYGQPYQQSAVPQFPPPPQSTFENGQPTGMSRGQSPIAPQPHNQNPYAQYAPPGSQPSYNVPDPRYEARTHVDEVVDQYDGRHKGAASDTERTYPQSPSRRNRSRRDDSTSQDSFDSRYDRGRSSSKRRQNGHSKSEKRWGKSQSRVREAFDTSQRSMGYSAVGALAGGLVGTEVGKGIGPPILGAVVGALGTNAFQARER